jgi:FtsP/CotA-like multicopper oxidase with cupredoxin domain
MSLPIGTPEVSPHLSRRSFVKSVTVGAALAGCGVWTQGASALATSGQQPSVLPGSEFDLSIGAARVDLGGATGRAIVVNGSLPGPTLRWRQGDTVTIRVTNALDEPTSIHWHGILVPANMDGVPGLSFHGIHPGETFTYRFVVRQSGTYWYHSHSGFQEQRGVYGAIVIEPNEPEPDPADREHVVVLSDWTGESPARVLAKLKKQPDYYNRSPRTLGSLVHDVRARGLKAALAERAEWARMRMSPTDLADVSGQTYRYLVNGRSPAANWTGLYEPGDRVRLRLINGSAMTYFDVRIPGVAMTVVAADGQPVRPITVDELRVAVAETYDVIVEPGTRESMTLFAQSLDRSGYARGTLAVRQGLSAAVPAIDPPVPLSMSELGHGGMSMAGMHHAGHDMAAMSGGLTHPAGERGNPLVDMQAMAPSARLDDPGIGLRDNGRRVLTYADLVSAFPDPDPREPTRTIELHLTGSMEKFAWSFDGIKGSAAEPIRLKYGERVRFVLVNDTMMTHPVHLHGLFSDLEDDSGNFRVRKHTIDMPPGTTRSFRVTASALGRWAFHCHLLYHMDTGMMREVRVEE